MALPLRRFCGTLRYRQADKQTPGNSFTEVIMVFFFLSASCLYSAVHKISNAGHQNCFQ